VSQTGPFQLPFEASRIAGVIELDIINRPAGTVQLLCELAHGREDQGDLFGVMWDVLSLAHNLGHHNHIGVFLPCPQG